MSSNAQLTQEHTVANPLAAVELPGVEHPVDWEAMATDDVYGLIHELYQHLADREPETPTSGVLQRSVQLEDTLRYATTLQNRYTGLIKDAFNSSSLRSTLELPEGKTAFRDPKDLLAKTHDIRANAASARIRLADAVTPVRASDPERSDDVAVGETRLPMLAAFQGRLNPSKLSSALSMIDEIDKNAVAAGKDDQYREKLRKLVDKDLAEKIEHTTCEEFSRYVGQRKNDLLASVDPDDQNFRQQHTEAMHDVRRVGPVRGNKNAIEYRLTLDAEGDEATQTLLATLTNPRGKGDDEAFERRSAGQRRMHALRDVIKFGLANLEKAGFRGASGAHTQMTVITDYATLLEGIRNDLADALPEVQQRQREELLALLAQLHSTKGDNDTSHGGDARVPEPIGQNIPAQTITLGDTVLTVPPPKKSDVGELFDDDNLDRLQQRISRGSFTNYIPPDVILRMRCDVGVSPITMTGHRQVLSIGRQQRQFPDALRRAIVGRDRGCAVPGCHWAASLCELHHVQYWSKNGETSTENGVTLCAHHHQAIHAGQLRITRVDGEFRFVLHPLLDPTQQPRKNYFYQT